MSCIYSAVMYVDYIMSYGHPWQPSKIKGVIKRIDLVYLLRSNHYVSYLYIMDRNPRLSSYTIGVTYSYHISLLPIFGDFPLTSKTGGCCNLLESTPARITLIKSIHKWTRIQFIISNYKLGICLCSQPRVDIHSQSTFYDVITKPYHYLSNTLYKTTCM